MTTPPQILPKTASHLLLHYNSFRNRSKNSFSPHGVCQFYFQSHQKLLLIPCCVTTPPTNSSQNCFLPPAASQDPIKNWSHPLLRHNCTSNFFQELCLTRRCVTTPLQTFQKTASHPLLRRRFIRNPIKNSFSPAVASQLHPRLFQTLFLIPAA